jgi:nitroreductase
MPDFNQPAVQSAPVVFVVTALKKRSGYNREGSSETLKGNGWQMYDCALSNMLLCLEATEQGLGTVIMGYFDEDMIRQIVEIPETEEINAVIAMGYPDEMPEMPKRKGTDVILKIL